METTITTIRCESLIVTKYTGKKKHFGLCIAELHHTIYSTGLQETVLFVFFSEYGREENNPIAIFTNGFDNYQALDIKDTKAEQFIKFEIAPL